MLAFLLLAGLPGPALAQQLTYKTHTEVRRLQFQPSASPVDKVVDQAGRDLRHLLLSGIESGAADSLITVSDGAVRIEHQSDGTVEIIRPRSRYVSIESCRENILGSAQPATQHEPPGT